MRERLIRLIDQADEECKHTKDCKICSGNGKGSQCMNYHIADYLLANGVVVLPCKVGDIVYLIGLDGTINEHSAVGFCQYPNGVFIDVLYAEKTYSIPIEQVYFLREDAERALKGEKE